MAEEARAPYLLPPCVLHPPAATAARSYQPTSPHKAGIRLLSSVIPRAWHLGMLLSVSLSASVSYVYLQHFLLLPFPQPSLCPAFHSSERKAELGLHAQSW